MKKMMVTFWMLMLGVLSTTHAADLPQAQESNAYGVYTLRSFFPDEVVEQAPMPRDKTVPVSCCGLDEAQPDDPEPAIGPKLGREIPDKQYDYGNFRAVVGKDGKTRYFPRVAKFIDADKKKAPPPAAINYGMKAPTVLKKMYLNDRLGCCVWSSRAHQWGIVTAVENGTEDGALATDDEIRTAYRTCGPGDNGCNMAAVNQYQQKYGAVFGGKLRKTLGSVSVDHTNKELVKTMIVVFGGLNIGMNLPSAWINSKGGSDWAPTNTNIVGGHEVQAIGYDDVGVWVSSWGNVFRITWAAFTSRRWIDECYASLLPEWYAKDGVADNGIDKTGLELAFAEVADGRVPVLPDPKPPVVPPVVPPVTPPVTPPTPAPTSGFTGTLTYKNGVLVNIGGEIVSPPVTPPVTPPGVVPTPGSANADALEELRDRIAKHYARMHGAGIRVSDKELAAARAKVDSEISDKALLKFAIDKGIPIPTGNKAGAFSDFFQWIVAHQAEIKAFIEFIISLFGGFGQVDVDRDYGYANYGVEYVLVC